MTLLAFQGSLELGLIYGLLALGIFLSFRILNVADLTVDSSFTSGAAVSALLTLAGHPYLGLLAGFAVGTLAGFVTAFLQTKLKIQPILAGILTMTGLYSINLVILGGSPNVSLLRSDTVFTPVAALAGGKYAKLLAVFVLAVLVCLLLSLFFKTKLGLSIRATGDNEDMVRASSINSNFTKTIGLMLANGLAALSGAVLCQYQSFVDVNMGTGMVVVGLASLIIGEIIFGKRGILRHAVAVVLGSCVYRIIIALVLQANLAAFYPKLISALIVTLAVSYPAVREKFQFARRRRRKPAAGKAEGKEE